MSLVLTATIPGAKYEFHMLKPGEHFERFGGSRHALIAGKGGAMIVREHLLASDQIRDTEYNPADRGVWQSIAKWINDTTGEKADQMADLGQTLVKHRRDATAFPTEEKAYKALCDIGAQPSAYAIRAFRQLGSTFKKDWYALCTHTNEWLKMPNTVTQTTMPDLLTIEYNPSRMLRTGIAQHGSDFMQYFAYVLYGMAENGTTQCSAYLKWARGIEALIKETE